MINIDQACGYLSFKRTQVKIWEYLWTADAFVEVFRLKILTGVLNYTKCTESPLEMVKMFFISP